MSRDDIAATLKRLRERSGLTANQVGKMIGKSGKTVNGWENNRGQPDAETLMQLCDIYNVTDILAEFSPRHSKNRISLSDHEKDVILAYRATPHMQDAVDKLLGVTNNAPTTNNSIISNSIVDDIADMINAVSRATATSPPFVTKQK